MQTFTKPLTSLTAEDLMSRDVLVIPHHMSMRAVANMLAKANVSGAPVVDDTGTCIGVISSADFLRVVHADRRTNGKRSDSCVCTAWQMVEMDQVPTEEVSTFMSKDPVTVSTRATIVELSKIMTSAHIHRVIVVDNKKHPIGIVSSTDVVAAVSREE